ncbi:hypothetical protein HMPREF2139_08940 [Prevotella denticola DNF00960]|nr:hypothetical protein HMPREF2139_08940 [Prevotella denticola DNF00960]
MQFPLFPYLLFYYEKKNNYVLSQSILTCLEIDRIHSGILPTVTRISNKPYLGLNRALLGTQLINENEEISKLV